MEIIKSWDPIWDNIYKNQEWGKYPGESLIQFIARNFYNKDRKCIKILEIGCGTGSNIWYLSREGFDTYGIDGSEIGIHIASSRLKDENLRVHLKIGDIIKLDYENNFFDCVIDCECIYANSWNNSFKIINEIERVLKPSGLFYSRTFSNNMFVGNSLPNSEFLEYTTANEGPLRGKGYFRLMDQNLIQSLYGKIFNISSIDLLEYTRDNGNMKISEWIINCKK